MDALSAEFGEKLRLSGQPGDRWAAGWASDGQEDQRVKLLMHQRQYKFNYQWHSARLANNNWEDMQGGAYLPCKTDKSSHFQLPGPYYKNQLMTSEWMTSVPADFASHWIMMMCPRGQRSLVISSQGSTYCYNKAGVLLEEFPSQLPGGCRSQAGNMTHQDFCILDCVYVAEHQTFYVIDLMCWRSHAVYDTETEFRLYWLTNKLAECPQARQITKLNKYKFLAVANYACLSDNIALALKIQKPPYQVDGLLFYHKRAHYMFGKTPLVLWLRTWMLPEILNIPVPTIFMVDQPVVYSGMYKYIELWNKKHDKDAKNKQTKASKQKKSQGKKQEQSTDSVKDNGEPENTNDDDVVVESDEIVEPDTQDSKADKD